MITVSKTTDPATCVSCGAKNYGSSRGNLISEGPDLYANRISSNTTGRLERIFHTCEVCARDHCTALSRALPPEPGTDDHARKI